MNGDLGQRILVEIKNLDQKLTGRIDHLDRKFGDLDGKIGEVKEALDEFRAATGFNYGALSMQIDALRADLQIRRFSR